MKKSGNTRFVIGTLVIAAALVWLVATSMRSTTLRAVPVGELRAADRTPHSLVGQRLRVVGFVGHEALRRTPQQTAQGLVNITHFSVTDEKGSPGGTVLVEYRDALPDTFRAGGPVQVDGVYTSAGTMRADHVFTKCPSKYEEAKPGKSTSKSEIKNADYRTGQKSQQQ